MRAFIINLNSATDRWLAIERAFAPTGFQLERVPAVIGDNVTFPKASFAESSYHWFHGRRTNSREVGCYLSHVKAMEAFLATDESHGFIGEDDIVPLEGFEQSIHAALSYAKYWNVLRVTGLSEGKPGKVAALPGGRHLCIGFGRLKGAGGYVVDRAAAQAFVKGLLPMWLPFDHAVDREWFFGLSAAYILPFPASQTEHDFPSSIQKGQSRKLASWRRFFTTYPYQAGNELSRWIFRSLQYLRIKLAGVPPPPPVVPRVATAVG